MRWRRRARPDPEREAAQRAFESLAEPLDAAQRALLAVIPTSRDPGIPLAQGLAAFEAGAREALARMPAWRRDAVEREWLACREALERALAEAERLRLEPAELDFEALNARVGDVLAPLEAFADAERRLRKR